MPDFRPDEVRGLPLPVFRPGLALAVPFMAGLVAADVLPLETGALVAGLAACAVLLPVSVLLRGCAPAVPIGCAPPERRRVAVLAALVATALLAGALRMTAHLDLPPEHAGRVTPAEAPAALSGVVVTGPVFRKRPALKPPPPGAPAAGSWSFEVEADQILAPAPRPVTGRVLVSAYAAPPPLLPGDRVVLRGTLRAPRAPTNPGQIDHASRLRRQGIHRVMSVSGPDGIEPVGTVESPGLDRAVAVTRQHLLEALGRSLRDETAAFLGALLLGAPGDLSDDVETAFRRTGTYHLIAISGFHLMLLWGALAWCFDSAAWTGRMPRLVILVVLAVYTLLTGLLASAVRSFLMVAAVIGADLAGRRRDPLSSLAAAALVITAADPVAVFDAGFQLSFLAVFGILRIHPILRAAVTGPGQPLDRLLPAGRLRRLRRWLAAQARDGVCVSMAAWLVTGPLVASCFHLLTPVMNAANLVLCPLVVVELVGAALKTAAGLAGGLPDTALAWVLERLYDATAISARTLAAIPGAWSPVAGLAPLGLAAYVAVLLFWVRRCRRNRPRSALAGVAASVVLLGLSRTDPAPPEGFRVTTLDVGQGSAHICEAPEGGVVVYDCGSSGYPDPGRSVVAPALWSQGRTAIDLLILSHPDVDHINGTAFLLSHFRVGALAISPVFERLAEGAALVRKAENEGVPVLRVAAGDRVAGVAGAEVRILGPAVGTGAARLSGNGASLLVRVSGVTGSVLFTGDVDAKGLAALPAGSLPGLDADAVVVPHHGSPGSRSPSWVRSVGARVALVSARRGFASKRVLDDYRDGGAAVLETRVLGAVRLESRAGVWTVRSGTE
jgi:competence protein ComEC